MDTALYSHYVYNLTPDMKTTLGFVQHFRTLTRLNKTFFNMFPKSIKCYQVINSCLSSFTTMST